MTFNPLYIAATAILLSSPVAFADDINFGDDSSEYSKDGECDDPRFTGEGMASGLDVANMMKDATDCSKLIRAQMIRPVRTKEESSPSECTSIDFGDNSSEWANDGKCDDPRFTGGSADEILLMVDLLGDANDCSKLCASGGIWLK